MISLKKHLPRRTFLRGAGAAIALPLLDSMIPAFAARGDAAARPVRRFGAFYLPNGVSMGHWTPTAEGAAFELPTILQPLTPFRDQVLVLSGLSNKQANAQEGDGAGDHSRGQTAFLTGAHAKRTAGRDAQAGISMDQIAAQEIGQHTQLASLELALESNDVVGGCDEGLSCVYSATISWRNANTPVPMESDPRAVFERLFGAAGSTDLGARRARMKMERSILDSVTEELSRLQQRLGPGDRTKIAEYVDSVREVERRIQKAEQQSVDELPLVDQPAGVPVAFEAYFKLMLDLMALAYQCDLTRVGTFLVGREKSVRTYPEIGVPEAHHSISHHQNRPAMLDKLARISHLHTKMFAYFLEKLRSTPDGDGSLLDHGMFIYGGGLSNGNLHLHEELPIVLVGGAVGQIEGGRHLRFPKDTPLTNLHLTVLDKMGIAAERLGDSNGRVELLSDV